MNQREYITDFKNCNDVEFNGLNISLHNMIFESPLKDILTTNKLNILELGCGYNPHLLLLIKNNFQGHNYIGVDKSRNRSNYQGCKVVYNLLTQKWNVKEFLSASEFTSFIKDSIHLKTRCNVFLDEDSKSYHLILAINLFHHLPPREFSNTLIEIKNKLSIDGLFYFDINPNFNSKDTSNDKAEEYLSILDKQFNKSKAFIIQFPGYNVSRIVYQNLL